MWKKPVKFKFHSKKYLFQDQSREVSDGKRKHTEQTKIPPASCEEEYLTNKALSIMTDTKLDPGVMENVYLRQKKHANAGTSNSSSDADLQDYILISSEEIPVKLRDVSWECVNYDDIIKSAQRGVMKKYCSPRCSSAWFLKIRREIFKICHNKIYPMNGFYREMKLLLNC